MPQTKHAGFGNSFVLAWDALCEFGNVTTESCANLTENCESKIALATFDAANIRAIYTGPIGKIFLRPIQRLPLLTNSLSQNFKRRVFHSSQVV